MDMRMNAYSFRMLYVFPPLSADAVATDCTSAGAYDLDQLERSFEELLRHDYPLFLDGEITSDVLATLEYSLTPHRDSRALLAVKCTPLRDGGLVIGVNVNHCVFDAEACFAFVTQWGMHYRRFISTTDALTALLTLLVTQARGHGNDVNVGTAVNGRRRLQPPLPAHYAGNVVFTAFSCLAAADLTDPSASIPQQQQQLAHVAQKIRQSIQRQDDAFMRDSIEFLESHGPTRVSAATKFFFGSDVLFSSWLGLGSLNADFGSRPLRVSNSQVSVLDGVVVFQEISELDRDDEGKTIPGVDAMVYLEVEAMARLEKLWRSAKEAWAVPT
ncbi:hypothetical protein PybrP1_000565 [[Pythium] brassicae (nom. inval.)]|nr:hypothetical protein PybrP1_000565 [[Pythium] brassicae (nom. inval.)]